LYGRVLVIDGVEKAERNVLPILNNLLENREMQLDDGRFLMAADKFDKLLQVFLPPNKMQIFGGLIIIFMCIATAIQAEYRSPLMQYFH
jgi:hypothetical protein